MVSYRSTENSIPQRIFYRHRYVLGSRKGVVMMPGHTQDRDQWAGFDTLGGELRDITDRDFAIATMGTLSTWGNSALRTSMSTLRTNAQVAHFASGKVHLCGASAGGLAVLNWAKNNPTLVQSISLIIPALDPQEIYDDDVGGWSTSVSTAYGGRPTDANTPAVYAADLNGIPIKCWYSNTDTVTPAATTAAFCTAAGATAVNMGDLGHLWTQPGLGIDIGNWMREND